MKLIFLWLFDRLAEASTWQGIVTIATAAGVNVNPELALHIASVGAGVFGLISVVKKG